MNPNNYLEMLQQSINLSKSLNMPNLQWQSIEKESAKKHDSDFQTVCELVNGELFDIIDYMFMDYPYLGDISLDLSAVVFMYLKAKKFDVEMIYGNININQSDDDEFDTTAEYLTHEYENKINQGEQAVHAWIGIGDIIIDFALPDRLIEEFNYSRDEVFVIDKEEDFKNELNVQYKPILTGTDFFTQTNAYDPLDDRCGFGKSEM